MGKTTFITIYQLSCFVGHPVFKLTKINENDGYITIKQIGLNQWAYDLVRLRKAEIEAE